MHGKRCIFLSVLPLSSCSFFSSEACKCAFDIKAFELYKLPSIFGLLAHWKPKASLPFFCYPGSFVCWDEFFVYVWRRTWRYLVIICSSNASPLSVSLINFNNATMKRWISYNFQLFSFLLLSMVGRKRMMHSTITVVTIIVNHYFL